MKKPVGFDGRRSASLKSLIAASSSFRKAVMMSSFGKDSLCLLSLASEAGLEIEVAYFELGAVDTAHDFARRFIAGSSLRIRKISPHRTLCVSGCGGSALCYQFDLTCGGSIQIVGATFDDTRHPNLSCGLVGQLMKSHDHSPYDWDLIVTGRRRVDTDDTLGSLHIAAGRCSVGVGAEILMPIIEWLDEDVLYHLETTSGFYPDLRRYEIIAGALKSRADKTFNPDYAQVCIRCLAAVENEKITCPLGRNDAGPHHALQNRVTYASGDVPATVML